MTGGRVQFQSPNGNRCVRVGLRTPPAPRRKRPNSFFTRRDVRVRPCPATGRLLGTVTGPAVRHKNGLALTLVPLRPRGARNPAPTRDDCSSLAQEATWGVIGDRAGAAARSTSSWSCVPRGPRGPRKGQRHDHANLRVVAHGRCAHRGQREDHPPPDRRGRPPRVPLRLHPQAGPRRRRCHVQPVSPMVDSAAGLSEGPDRSTGLIAWLDGTGSQSRLSTTRH